MGGRTAVFLASLAGLPWATYSQATTTLFDPASCVPDSKITAFPNCNLAYDARSRCSTAEATGGDSAYIPCACNQAVFNAVIGYVRAFSVVQYWRGSQDLTGVLNRCENEERACFGGTTLDPLFQSIVGSWHSICDSHISFSPTTPSLSTVTPPASLDINFCTEVVSACQKADASMTACSMSNPNPVDHSSCLCQPGLIHLAYTCEVLAKTSCLHSPAAITDLELYTLCSQLPAVLGTTVGAPAKVSGRLPAEKLLSRC